MSGPKKSLRHPLAEVRGLGSAKNGTHHWFLQRVTALALIPLMIFVLNGFFANAVYGDFERTTAWLSSPFTAVFVIMFLGFAFHHAASGAQVVIEDYVHCEVVKFASLFLIRFFAIAFTLLGSLAVVKILFFTLLMPVLQQHGSGH